MKLTKEVKTGLLVTISFAIFFIGFYFLKGAKIFSKENEYICYYDNVDGLQNAANVQISGLNVGRVSQTVLAPGDKVKVVISMPKSIEIPVGTVATISSADLLGGKVIRLDRGKGPGMMKSGAELKTGKELGMLDNVTGELTPRLRELKETIAAFNVTLAGVNNIVGDQNQKAIAAAINSIKNTADNLSALTAALGRETGEIHGIVHNTNTITASLAKQSDTVQRILANASNVTRQLANAPIQKTLADLQATSAQLQGIMGKVNSSDGTLGLLINNKDVYNNLKNSLNSLDALMADLKQHPSRYINLTIFGKKKI